MDEEGRIHVWTSRGEAICRNRSGTSFFGPCPISPADQKVCTSYLYLNTFSQEEEEIDDLIGENEL